MTVQQQDGPAAAQSPITLGIAELARSGATVVLTLRLTNHSDDRAQVASTFDDGIFQEITSPDAGSTAGGSSLDGIYLIDPVNR